MAGEIINLLTPAICNELRTYYPGKCNGIVRCDHARVYTCKELVTVGVPARSQGGMRHGVVISRYYDMRMLMSSLGDVGTC